MVKHLATRRSITALLLVALIAVTVYCFMAGSPAAFPLAGLGLISLGYMAQAKAMDTEYSLNENDPNFTAGTATAAGSGDGATEALLGYFTCPRGIKVVVVGGKGSEKDSTLAAYLKDNEAAPAELADGSPVRLAWKDAAGQFTLDKVNTVYASIKDFADRNKMKRIGDTFSLIDTEKLYIYVIPATGVSLNPAASRFELRCRKLTKIRV